MSSRSGTGGIGSGKSENDSRGDKVTCEKESWTWAEAAVCSVVWLWCSKQDDGSVWRSLLEDERRGCDREAHIFGKDWYDACAEERVAAIKEELARKRAAKASAIRRELGLESSIGGEDECALDEMDAAKKHEETGTSSSSASTTQRQGEEEDLEDVPKGVKDSEEEKMEKRLERFFCVRSQLGGGRTPYPAQPYACEVGVRLVKWAKERQFPVNMDVGVHLLQEVGDPVGEAQASLGSVVEDELGAVLVNEPTEGQGWDAIQQIVEQVMETMQVGDLLALLGVRRTKGSQEMLPPAVWQLVDALNAPHTPDSASEVSVGGRALSKHAVRSKDSFWGRAGGKERERNHRAMDMLETVLTQCMWINVHSLPQDVCVVEIRQVDGYGMRWALEQDEDTQGDNPKFVCVFRGFLEPVMEGGHEVGWRH